jgi:hypothetical protein
MVDINFGACMYPFWYIFHKLFGGKFLHLFQVTSVSFSMLEQADEQSIIY